MAGSVSQDDDGEITGINVTPLVDVMLVLLIIFMVTSTYIVQQSIPIQLPKADSGDAITKTKNLAFVLDKQGNVYMDGKSTTIDAVPGQIKAIRDTNTQMTLQAMISADRDTQHGYVVKLLDAIRLQGITDVAISVEATSK
jgi:biopolymer transport protein ExbD